MPSYKECIQRLHPLDRSAFAAVLDKRIGKQVARDAGVRVPRDVPLPESYVAKPHNQWSSQGVTIMHRGEKVSGTYPVTIIEELITGEDGAIPAPVFEFYCFSYRAKLCQVYLDSKRDYHYDYRTIPDWERVEIDIYNRQLGYLAPRCLPELIAAAERLSRHFPTPIRVDLFASPTGPVFNEFCATPGVVGRITDAADAMLGQWFVDHVAQRREDS